MASSVIKSRIIWLLALIQIIDIAAHVATNQIEILRIISNLIIISWATIFLNQSKKQTDFLIIASFILLNLFFIFLNGLTNDGSPRIFFVGSVLTTLVLSAYLVLKKNNEDNWQNKLKKQNIRV
ncbi:hypothetical protein N9P10_02030 [Rhodobacteraceae bacterium]|nr:hypothetical protein [Paracoccaceae bacterium]|tara:strand:- start:131 stop:502 length:372 start_codon:yes stop_codon:yes gene_type:complete